MSGKSIRPRLDADEFEVVQKYRAIKQQAKEHGVNEKDIKHLWLKTKGASLFVKNPAFGNEISNDDFVKSFIKNISKHTPKYKSIIREYTEYDNLLVIDIADAHFGKLASAYETGKSYDTHEAKQRCIDGVSGIVSMASKYGFKKILMIIGNDVLHYDNPRNTTTSGTFQNTSVMFFDMFNIALETYVEIIEGLIKDYDVDIVFNPSNHDYQSGWMFARTLSAWFKSSKNVNIDDTIAHRKYYQFGVNMIGSNHGDGAKIDNLPLLMAQEQPIMWSETQFRYIYLHHIHHKQVYKFLSTKDFVGVTIEYLRSPSEADSWHHRNGYCGNKKAIEGFIHNYKQGQIGRLTHYF